MLRQHAPIVLSYIFAYNDGYMYKNDAYPNLFLREKTLNPTEVSGSRTLAVSTPILKLVSSCGHFSTAQTVLS